MHGESGRPDLYEIVEALGIHDPEEAEKYLQSFIQRRGGFTLDALAHAVREPAEDKERLFAILALGRLATPEARALLLPFLGSMVPLERWASAFGVGASGGKEALPVLCAMLTESLPKHQEEFLATDSLYEAWRHSVPHLLAAMGDPAAVPALRRALEALVHLLGQETLPEEEMAVLRRARLGTGRMTIDEVQHIRSIIDRTGHPVVIRYQTHHPDAVGDIPFNSEDSPLVPISPNIQQVQRDPRRGRLGYLISYQDEIIYALGQLGALGALTGLWAAKPFLHIWMVHLLMGYLHDQYSAADISALFIPLPALETDIKRRLLQCFGLTPEEQEQALAIYVWTKMASIRSKYGYEQYEHGQGKGV